MVVKALKAGTQVSVANAAGVAPRLHQGCCTAFGVNGLFQRLRISVLPFDFNSAMVSGPHRRVTDHYGLKTGERPRLTTVYLKVGMALTVDQACTQVELPDVDIRCIS
ncbi:MAG: hypothetical protein OXC69_02545 [Candidatus Tectomicrobia bacterium]|nr:hypothetical protein [Candidatus Tectomicrobia bacterium]